MPGNTPDPWKPILASLMIPFRASLLTSLDDASGRSFRASISDPLWGLLRNSLGESLWFVLGRPVFVSLEEALA